jgi:8-oxo-dGTP pyrophosphatase MutT (NUDIX family)
MSEHTPINWVKAMCIVKHAGKLLVSRDLDKVKRDFYFRPLGGSIDYREKSDDTVKREFMEELGVNLYNLKYLGVIENIFTMDGDAYHEIDFIYEGDILENEIYDKNEIEFPEGGKTALAMWVDYEEFTSGRLKLVPEEIFKYININK